MSDFRIVRTLPETDWRHFLAENPGSNIFHTPEMFEVFSMAKGHTPSLWAAVDVAGRPLALFLPVQINVFGGLLRQFATRAVAYGSVLYETSDSGREALAFLLTSYGRDVSGKPLFTELRNLTDLGDAQRSLLGGGFVYEEHLNYIIDINLSEETIFDNIKKRTRKRIRNALNRGEVVVKEVKTRDGLLACYDLLRKTYRSVRVPLADYSLFEAAFNVLYPRQMIRFVLAYVDQVPVATSIELMYKDAIYGWYNGMDRNYSRYIPNDLLMWDILKWGSDRGYRVYDFGGAGKPDVEYGVREFKSKFGGVLVCFGRNTLVHAPIRLRVSTLGYKVFKMLHHYVRG